MDAFPISILRAIGAVVLGLFSATGRISIFAVHSVRAIVTPPFYGKAFLSALFRIGFTSLPVVGLTAIFTGAALALNIYDGSLRFNAEAFLPQILGVSITRELGPVLAALMLAGRAASAMAAELGTMRVTEQIDAMTTLAVKPFHYLVAPRVLAATLALPLLVLTADIIGILGGWLVAVYALDFSGPIFIRNLSDFLALRDVTSGLLKAGIFGFIISVMGCYYGYYSAGGAQGVGTATRTAVVAAAVMILASNYVLTTLFVRI
ncbi:MAG: MlaE family lipid ABC transporter permease subunit [Pseudomonadota bacterium]